MDSRMKSTCTVFFFCLCLGLCRSISREFCPPVSGTRVALSNRQLAEISENIPADTVYLDISSNVLIVLRNGSFSWLTLLASLDASQNQITKLESKAFSGLTELCYLNLQGNKLSLTYQAYPQHLFIPIQQLRILRLENNTVNADRNTINPARNIANVDCKTTNADRDTTNANRNITNADCNTTNGSSRFGHVNESYPDGTFKYLPYLRELHIDGQNRTVFGEGFEWMSSLEFLYLSGQISSISNETFQAFSRVSIKTLLLDSDIVNYTPDTRALLPLKKLQSLTMEGYIGIDKGLRSLYGKRFQNMTDITLNGVNPRRPGLMDPSNYMLDQRKMEYLASICTSEVDLSNNGIIFVQAGSFSYPSNVDCLKVLRMGQNRFNIGSSSVRLYELNKFINLRFIDISAMHRRIPLKVKRRNHERDDGRRFSRATLVSDDSDTEDQGPGELVVSVPPYLEVIRASYVIGAHTKMPRVIRLKNAANLREIDCSYGGVEGCAIEFYGFETLEILNISGWNCSVLHPHFFYRLPSLKTLVMRNINLNTGLVADPDGELFSHLTHVLTLDMSANGLTRIHDNLLSTLANLESLSIANNKLMVIQKAVTKLNSLNALTSIVDTDRKWLDSISPPVTLILQGNPLTCTCQTVGFLRWILETRVAIWGKNNLTCMLENGTLVTIDTLRRTAKNFEIICVSNFWLIFCIIMGCSITVLLILTIVAYRFRWNIKYWVLTKFKRRPDYEPIDPDRYWYDAFVAYNHQDYHWVVHTLRPFLEDGEHKYSLCLHHRDFPAGESIQQIIVDAINWSKKIIIVVSRKYLRCDWAEFEIRMTGMRMVQEGRENVVIVIMLEDIPVREMPRSLLNMWQTSTFLLWSRDPLDERLFWSRLFEAIAR